MSEPTWTVRPRMANGCHVIDADGVSIYVEDDTSATAQYELAQRIASLLSQDDERIARDRFEAAYCATQEQG